MKKCLTVFQEADTFLTAFPERLLFLLLLQRCFGDTDKKKKCQKGHGKACKIDDQDYPQPTKDQKDTSECRGQDRDNRSGDAGKRADPGIVLLRHEKRSRDIGGRNLEGIHET